MGGRSGCGWRVLAAGATRRAILAALAGATGLGTRGRPGRASLARSEDAVAAADGFPRLGLPWAVGETWILGGGPHSAWGEGAHPRSALDFSPWPGGSGAVRAAADGVAAVGCAAEVRLDHADGWQTGYSHLGDTAVSDTQRVVRGQRLGTAAGATGGGGTSGGPHVHFTLQRHGVHQEIAGLDLGGWVVEEGADDYQGCLVTGTVRACANDGAIRNDGTVGRGGTPPVPAATPAWRPRWSNGRREP
jgi:murein DD-endopeptidase MepM/ murein hydrolase activator NlpD